MLIMDWVGLIMKKKLEYDKYLNFENKYERIVNRIASGRLILFIVMVAFAKSLGLNAQTVMGINIKTTNAKMVTQMAKKGYNYKDILTHYYTNIKIIKK